MGGFPGMGGMGGQFGGMPGMPGMPGMGGMDFGGMGGMGDMGDDEGKPDLTSNFSLMLWPRVHSVSNVVFMARLTLVP